MRETALFELGRKTHKERIGAKLIKPTFIDASYASYSGACRAFLDQLPRGIHAAAIPHGTIPPTANFPPPGGTPPPPKAM